MGEERGAMTNKDKEIAWLRAGTTQHPGGSWDRPLYVPSRVRLSKRITGDFPYGYTVFVEPGDYDCQCNRNGAVSVVAGHGKLLGLKPGEFEPIAWRNNVGKER